MDWYAWLSKTNLDQMFLYEYALAFAQNQLQEEDLAFFNHEFLQSIGIYIAKHRIEIIKLARKDVRVKPSSLWRLVSAMSKTKKLFSKKISKLSFRKIDSYPIPEPTPAQSHWIGALRRISEAKEKEQMNIMENKRTMRSGPLDRIGEEKSTVTSRNFSLSGPLEGKVPERLTYQSPMVGMPIEHKAKERAEYYCRSPSVPFPVDRWGLSPNVKFCSSEKRGYDNSGDKSLWSLMFQDIKPT